MTSHKKKYSGETVFQTASGEWRGRVTLTDPDTGKKLKPKYFYNGKSETEIRRKIKAYKNNPLNYVGEKVGQTDAAHYFRNWADTYKKQRVKISTYDRLDSILRLYIEPELSGIQLQSVRPDDCNNIIVKYKNKGLSHSTVKKIYDALNACFRFAEDRHDVVDNPMKTVEMPKARLFDARDNGRDGVKNLTEDEERVFLAEIERKTASTNRYIYRYRDAFVLALNSGLRIGELVALDWSDVDFEKKIISVSKTAVMTVVRGKDNKPNGKVVQVIQDTPKTSKSTRKVPLNKKAIAALERLKEQAEKSEYVFPTQTGARIVISSLSKQYDNIAQKCGIYNTSFHSLRHTFATRLFEKGANVKEVSTLLGHATVGITYNTYIHVIDSRKSSITNLLDDNE